MIERPVGGISDMLEFALSESIKQSYEEFLLWTFADPPSLSFILPWNTTDARVQLDREAHATNNTIRCCINKMV
jgi:hypothetical protein